MYIGRRINPACTEFPMNSDHIANQKLGQSDIVYSVYRSFAVSWVWVCPCSASHHNHRRRSDWNSGGTHGGTYYKSPAVETKKHIFLHCNASNLVLKILQHDKIWGDNLSRSKFWGGDLSSRSPRWSTPMIITRL